MGNRTFLYTSDTLPAAIDGPAPDIRHAVASGHNAVPTLWRVLFSDAVAGPAQDAQQIFLPSVSAGIYAERGLAERRLFTLLDFVAQHPLLPDPAAFRRMTTDLRQFLTTLSGQAYSADLNEYFMMLGEEDFDEDEYDFEAGSPAGFSDDTPLDTFMQQCARTWQKTERAMALNDYDSIVNLYEIDLRDALDSLGFGTWEHDNFFSARHGSAALEEHRITAAAGKMDVLACRYDTIHNFRYQDRVGLLAHEEDSGYTLVDAQGRPHTAQPYDWLCKESYEAAQAWHFFPLGQDIASAWSRHAPIYGWRDSQGWRIYPDGREESELDYQLRRAPGADTADACKVLGDIYARGQGVDVDQAKACAYYAKAAAGGNKDAQYEYGYCLMEGLGCEQDAAAARRQFEALVPENKMALNCLAYLYECRLGEDIDPVRARALYIEAAEGGEWGLALAQKNAGNCYLYGIGGDVDKKIALDYYELAAKDSDFPERVGNADACRFAGGLCGIQAALADMANDAEGETRWVQRAIHYYKEMLLYGLEEAHVNLARCHLGELGGEPNLDAARHHLREALEYTWHADEAQELWDQYQLG